MLCDRDVERHPTRGVSSAQTRRLGMTSLDADIRSCPEGAAGQGVHFPPLNTVKRQAIVLVRVLVGLSGARVSYLAIGYWMSGGTIPRFKVESAWVAFVMLGMTLRFLLGGVGEPEQSFVSRRGPHWIWAGFCGLAL